MSTTTGSLSLNAVNVMNWCEVRLNKEKASDIIREHPEGLSNEIALKEALRVQDYVGLLKSVWGERDREKRLAWLQTKSFEAVLPYELALAEFKMSPSIETLATKTLPFFAVASARARIDVACSRDKPLGSFYLQMENTYYQALGRLIIERTKVDSSFPLSLSKENRIKNFENSIRKLQELKENIPALSSPRWVENCDVGSCSPSNLWESRRRAALEEILLVTQIALNELQS